VVALVAAFAAACGIDDDGAANESAVVAASTAVTVDTSAPSGVPQGFDTVAGRVVAADGSTCDVCLWLAEGSIERRRGLMGVTDLGGKDGMAFVYTEPRTTAFTMQNTLLPLSIAFFDADGEFMDEFDMEPCTAEPCDTYPTPEGFSVAVEVEQGDLDMLGIAQGARLELAESGCPAAG
jgi:uncharacterized protein